MGAWRCVMVPTTKSRSACRGMKRGNAAPKLFFLNHTATTEKYSIPQHAVTNGYGKNEYLRAQLIASAIRVVAKLSGNALPSSTAPLRVVEPLTRKLASLRRLGIQPYSCVIYRVGPPPAACPPLHPMVRASVLLIFSRNSQKGKTT